MPDRLPHSIPLLLLALALCLAACTSPARPTVDLRPTATPYPTATMPLGYPSTVLEAQVVDVYLKAAPSVVNVKNYVSDSEGMQADTEAGVGTGLVYDDVGHIVTNYHVVKGADSVVIGLADGDTYQARVVGIDATNDLAILYVDGVKMPPPLEFADSDNLVVGQFVLAIGNPFGYERTLTFGVISALGRIIASPNHGFIGRIIQTDASINPGNSGGPLLDLQGRVVGINVALVSPETGSAGVGFAVSANTVQRVVPIVIRDGSYPHPWLGFDVVPLTPAAIRLFKEHNVDVPVTRGLYVTRVFPLGPASFSGLRGSTRIIGSNGVVIGIGGDLITAIDGRPMYDVQELTVYIEENKRVGDIVELTVLRDGAEQTIRIRLATRRSLIR